MASWWSPLLGLTLRGNLVRARILSIKCKNFEIMSGMSPATRCAPGELMVPKCMWFTNYTFITEEPTLPDTLRTYQDIVVDGNKYDWTKVEYQLYVKTQITNNNNPL